jgi:hypothetical protein
VNAQALGRFSGRGYWLDAASDTFVAGRIHEAILRESGIALDLEKGEEPYTVMLSRGEDGSFRGEWVVPEGNDSVGGHVQCWLHVNPEHCVLSGFWDEEGFRWRWIAELDQDEG